jgi:hypothetical protein
MPDPRHIRDLSGLDLPALQALGASLAPVRTLGDVMEWADSRQPGAAIDEIVTQDDYTHDVLVPLGDRWVVFDVT